MTPSQSSKILLRSRALQTKMQQSTLTNPRVKICGITSVDDALAAASAGADAIGLVFYPPSSRFVEDLSVARDIALAVGPFVSVVGLFVDAEERSVEQILNKVPLHVLQFHGNESDAECSQYKRPYFKALRMKSDLDVMAQIDEFPGASGILLDAYVKGAPGGTGQRFDWHRVPAEASKPIILAGGLTPENANAAAQVNGIYALDVSGGVESAPGQKDHKKLAEFIAQAKLEK